MKNLKLYFGFLVNITCWWRVNSFSPRTAERLISASGFQSFRSVHLDSKTCTDDDGALNDANENHVGSDNDVNDSAAKVSKVSQPSKLDLYDSDELTALLEMHQQLQSTMMPPKTSTASTKDQTTESPNDIISGGLHEFILQTINEIEEGGEAGKPPCNESWISDEVRTKVSNLDIVAIASDVDGTIVGFDRKIHPRTRDSIRAAQESADIEWIFPATGKTRWGARNSLGSDLSGLTEGPGVYVQGLYCLGKNGEVIFEKKLNSAAVNAVEQLVSDSEVANVAYDRDSLYSTTSERIEVVELHEKFGEPASQKLSNLSEHSPGINKILLLDNNEKKLNHEVRPRLEDLAKEYGCVVTQAVPTMLEILPSGCSKARGVQMVCKHLGIDPAFQLMSIGDAENDVEMLEVSALGVAVGNSCNAARNASDIVLPLNCSEGGVGLALEEILGLQ